MKDLETNKIVASILVASLIAMFSGKVANFLYHPKEVKERGFAVEVTADAVAGEAQPKEEETIDISVLMASANVDKGNKIFKKCAACHSADKGGPNKVGPALYNVLGRDVASHAGYGYSDALKAIGGKWDYAKLFEFLKKPKDYAPGTKMSFAGLKKPEDIANLVAYLRQSSDNPLPLP